MIFRCDAPDAAGFFVAAGVAEGVLGVAFDGVVPVGHIHRAVGALLDVHGDEAEVRALEDDADFLFLEVRVVLHPFVQFDFVGGLVAHAHEVFFVAQVLGPVAAGEEFLAAGAAVGGEVVAGGDVDVGVGRIERVHGAGEDGMAADVEAPVVEGDAPGVRAHVAAKGEQAAGGGGVAEEAALAGADGAVGRLDLAVMEDALAEDKIALGTPDEVVQGVVAVLGAEAGEQLFAVVGLAVAIGVFEEGEVWLIGDEDAAVAELKAERNGELVGPDAAFVGAVIAVGVLENEDTVLRSLAGHDLRVGGARADPQAAFAIKANGDGLHEELREVFLGGEEADFEARVDLEGGEFRGGREPFVDGAVSDDDGKGIGLGVVWGDWIDLIDWTDGGGPNGLVASFSHLEELLELSGEVHDAVGLHAAAFDVVVVQRAVVLEELVLLFDHSSTDGLVELRRRLLRELVVEVLGEGGVAFAVEVDAVGG